MSPPSNDPAVLVVGAGPVGLTLACDLRRHGIACRIIDAGDGPTPADQSRALAVHARTMEVFDDMGVAAELLAQGRRIAGLAVYSHGRRFAQIQLDFQGLNTPYPFILSVPQGVTERLLIQRLNQLGGTVDWRTRLVDLSQQADCVRTTIDVAGRSQQVTTPWLIACDGIHSTVRERLGLRFNGVRNQRELFLLADVDLRWQQSDDRAHLLLVRRGLLAALPLPRPGRWRLIDATGEVSPGTRPEPPQIAARMQRLLCEAGFPAAEIIHTQWTSAFQIQRRIVQRFGVGRCLLAGDAAHVHSPVGGQGMNVGIQDAYNLGWKLAAVITGTATPALLESYDAERAPAAASIVRGTHRATWVATLRNPAARTARNALLAVLSRMGPLRRRMTGSVSELAHHYRGGPLSAQEGHRFAGGPRPGQRVGDLVLDNEDGEQRRLLAMLRGTRHTVLLFDGHTVAHHDDPRADDPAGADWPERIATVARIAKQHLGESVAVYHVVRQSGAAAVVPAHYAAMIADLDGRLHRHFAAARACLYLIRPDGYVGYRAAPPDARRLADYLTRCLHTRKQFTGTAGELREAALPECL